MDSQPTPPVDPVRQQLAAEAARGPIRVIIQQPPASWLGRIFRWGFTLLVALFVLGSLVNFYHEDDKLAEHWHSLSTTATDRIAIISIEGAIIGEQEFFKQQIDYVRGLGDELILAQPPRVQQVLGWYTRVVTSLDDYYRPAEERLYRAGQG